MAPPHSCKTNLANGNSSAYYFLLTHLCQYIGALLRFDAGNHSPLDDCQAQYHILKFMNLSKSEMDYFITQVGLSAASFGVATSDVEIVGTALSNTFNIRCPPPTVLKVNNFKRSASIWNVQSPRAKFVHNTKWRRQ